MTFASRAEPRAKAPHATFGIIVAQAEVTINAFIAIFSFHKHFTVTFFVAFSTGHRSSQVTRAFFAITTVKANSALITFRS